MKVINKQVCDKCGHTINEREINLYSGMVRALWVVGKWCKENGKYEFTRKEIKHLFKSENDTARFGDWIMFGGLVYKPDGKGTFGINRERCREFFSGQLAIPTRIWKNSITKETRPDNFRKIHEIPNLLKLIDSEGNFIVRYN